MKNFKLLSFILVLSTLLISCGPHVPSQQETEQNAVEANIIKLSAETELPNLKKSLERVNIKKRLELFEDENKVSYIYLTSFGRVMSFFTVKGKVSSGSKRMTTNQKLQHGDAGESYGDFVMEAPSLDGTYGSSDEYIFFWTTDDTYIQWNGEYMLCDKPLKLTTAPELVREIK